MTNFQHIAHDSLAASGVSNRLANRPAVVLERIAMGGGAVRWYFCQSPDQLNPLSAVLRPGSAVSFYFDERISSEPEASRIRSRVKAILKAESEVMVGALKQDQLGIDALLVGDTIELDEFIGEHAMATRFFCGVFPARDNDGIAAITMVLPDADGVVRQHPH